MELFLLRVFFGIFITFEDDNMAHLLKLSAHIRLTKAKHLKYYETKG